jgi:hypothetical protein
MKPTSNGWIRLVRSDEAQALLTNHPNAFLLLVQIALRAKWKDCPITGLKKGQAQIGDWKKAGLKSQNVYRRAKRVLEACLIVTFKGTNKGTVATLIDSSIFAITADQGDEPKDNQRTTKERSRNDQSTTNKKDIRIDKSASRSIGEPSELPVTDTTRKEVDTLAGKVRALRPSWKLPFTHAEDRLLFESMATLDALEAGDWQTLRDYLHAKIPQGVPKWQPDSRSKFLETCADVWSHAERWKRSQASRKPKPSQKPQAYVEREQTDEEKAILADIMKAARSKATTTP